MGGENMEAFTQKVSVNQHVDRAKARIYLVVSLT